MGDILFVLKMCIYTLVLIVILQVKVGPTTLEQKLYEFTHNSQIAGQLQGVAQGAAHFIGVQYNHLTGHMKSKYIDQHSSSQRPGNRLESKLKELKDSINSKWEQTENPAAEAQ